MQNTIPLLVVFLVGVATKNNLLASAAGIVMIMGFMNLHRFYPLLENRGIELGLLFLTASLLVPFATGKVTTKDILHTITSGTGMMAILGGILGAYLNGLGLNQVTIQPEVIPGILIGVVVCVSFFGGVSVGPVMAAGITALLIRIFFR